jgi:hypothetical protein
LVSKFHVALHASHAALPMVRSEFRSNAALTTSISKLIPIMRTKAPAQLVSSAHNKVHFLKLALPSLKRTSTRRESEHCIGIFKVEKTKQEVLGRTIVIAYFP